MKLRVTEVEFDLPAGITPPDVIGKVFDVDDESELADKISDETGWCLTSLLSEPA